MWNACGVTQAVCVLRLRLIGGSLMRAAAAAGRPVYGYNRSTDGAQAATFDGFDASTDLTAVLTRAAADQALIVIAVPMPAVSVILAHRRHRPRLSAHRRDQRQGGRA